MLEINIFYSGKLVLSMFAKINTFLGEKLVLSVSRNQGQSVLRIVCKGWQCHEPYLADLVRLLNILVILVMPNFH